MNEGNLQSFQQQVADLLLRHRSFLDVTSKLQESGARVNRALMKAVTECGCIKVSAQRQNFPQDVPVQDWKDRLDTHLSGRLCDLCLDVVKMEMGKNLFYLAALCNLLDMSLSEVVEQESAKLSTLGVFNLR
jgi:NTP pyrophosphatase (non-canonical NTP hydrolase)